MKLVFAALVASTLLAPLKASAEEMEPPKIGTIMAQQQMRHVKLWLAGHAGNWPLADYELDALNDGFDDLNRQLGGDTVETSVGAAISALEKAIAAKDRAAFANAFDGLSAGCNHCHRALDHAFVVIKRPTLLPYSDQHFAPRR